MAKYYKGKKLDPFRLQTPIDEGLTQAIGAQPGAPRSDIIALIKEYLCRRGKKCSLCNKTFNRKNLVIDRRRPSSKGGGDDIGNLHLLCLACADLKGKGSMLDARKKLRLLKMKGE